VNHRPLADQPIQHSPNPSRSNKHSFRRLPTLVVGAALLGFPPLLAGAEPQAGKADPGAGQASAAEAPGALVIVGGGLLPGAVRDCFLRLAGGKKARLVVIPTASARGHQTKVFKSFLYWREQGAASVAVLHTLDREKANDPTFIKTLAEATGVWLAGGDQARLTAAYRGTGVEKELHKLLARGGVIGGTSAGASAMSSVMILGGNPLAQIGDGFGFLPNVVVDQHFQNRKRLNRLLSVLKTHPRCLGLGIDEQTAVIVKGAKGTILGNANVRVCLPGSDRKPASVRVLKAGEVVDLEVLSRVALPRIKSLPAETKLPSAAVKPRSSESQASNRIGSRRGREPSPSQVVK
jgi:cyanophycinase